MKRCYDVVVVGTGVAGCFAALNLPSDLQILMITKAEPEESDSYLAQGGICVMRGQDDFDCFMEDTLRAGHYENDRQAVGIMIASSEAIIDDLISYGVRFEQENGQLKYTREAAHSTARILFHEDITGEEITSVLLRQVKARENITILHHTTMLDLLQKDNHCEGVVIQNTDGDFDWVLAKHVILACGGLGGVFENSTNYGHITGDALAIALRRNVAVKQVNYVQIHPTTLYSLKQGRRFLISESVRGEGALLYNKSGQRFVNELLPRDCVAEAIRTQMEKDRMPYVWLSMKTIKEHNIKRRFPHIYEKCMEEGYNPEQEWIPVVPSQHYLMGGIAVDYCGRTTMSELYAVGETSCTGVHGANRLASNSLLEALVFAKRAALDIAAQPGDSISGSRQEAGSWRELDALYDINPEDYSNPKKYWEQCKNLIWAEIRKEEKENEKNESNNTGVEC